MVDARVFRDYKVFVVSASSLVIYVGIGFLPFLPLCHKWNDESKIFLVGLLKIAVPVIAYKIVEIIDSERRMDLTLFGLSALASVVEFTICIVFMTTVSQLNSLPITYSMIQIFQTAQKVESKQQKVNPSPMLVDGTWRGFQIGTGDSSQWHTYIKDLTHPHHLLTY